MKYMFTPDKSVIIISLLAIIGIYFMVTYIISANKWYSAIPTILVVVLFIYFAVKTPYCIYVEKDSIIVKQILGSIKITNISSIKPLDKNDLANTVRVFGNGGFFGYVGRFSSPQIGKFYMAAINKNKLVKVTTKEGQIYVINYPDTLTKLL